MLDSQPFKFKQFSIKQDQCAMKVGTDGVLLGAWCNLDHNPFSILDIGAGTGILSLMLAQRSAAELIDAIEIDDLAYEQCVENFEASSWGDRLFCYHAALHEFVNEIEETYDLIVCNPPFYSENYKTNNEQRNLARFQDALPFEYLVFAIAQLLSQHGTCNVIIPYSEETTFIALAAKNQLFPKQILHVKGHINADIKRSLIELSFTKEDSRINQLVIETKRHEYTQDYINLTKAFYLKM